MKEITLDIDTDYLRFYMNGDFVRLEDKIHKIPAVKERYIRESSNGRVNIRLVFVIDYSLFESLCLRAYLGDDANRIRADLSRYWSSKDVKKTGRCFDEKFMDGYLRCAGEWVGF